MAVAEAEELVPVAVELWVDERVTVPLMIVSVTTPMPPTSNETTLVDPLDVVVMVLVSVVLLALQVEPDGQELVDEEEEEVAEVVVEAYRSDAVICPVKDSYVYSLPVNSGADAELRVTMRAGVVSEVVEEEEEEEEDLEEEVSDLDVVSALLPMASKATSQILRPSIESARRAERMVYGSE